MTAEASARGRAARTRGYRAELAVVAWLRRVGWPDARTTRSGLGHSGTRQPGDVSWHPLIVLEVKDVATSAWPTWCRQVAQEAGPLQVPCVVRKTRGSSDVASWEVRVRLDEWVELLGGDTDREVHRVDQDGETWLWASVSMDALANAVAAVDR